jgi:hypothetical protein
MNLYWFPVSKDREYTPISCIREHRGEMLTHIVIKLPGYDDNIRGFDRISTFCWQNSCIIVSVRTLTPQASQ